MSGPRLGALSNNWLSGRKNHEPQYLTPASYESEDRSEQGVLLESIRTFTRIPSGHHIERLGTAEKKISNDYALAIIPPLTLGTESRKLKYSRK